MEPNTKSYICKKTRIKTQGPDLEAGTNFKGQYSNLENYFFGLGYRASENFTRMTMNLDWCLGVTYRDIFQTTIITKTSEIFPDPEIPTTTPYTLLSVPGL